jgi:AraC-like DNA-binding protein
VAVNLPPLVRELVLHASRRNTLRRDSATGRRLAQVILDQLETLPAEPLQLPMPIDPRATGASQRTLERLFLAETQMTFGRWRQRLRLVEALRLLAEGHAVTRVALDDGYQSPSAFVSAFRRELGTTPGRYFEA